MSDIIKPDCYKCVHRLNLVGNAHSRCNNQTAKVTGKTHGINMGWFAWPLNYDPVWLEACDGFSDDLKDKKPSRKIDPILELFSMLK